MAREDYGLTVAMPVAPAAAVAPVAAGAVSWSAIFAGAAVASACSLLLFALATGLDLASLPGATPRATAAFSTRAAMALIVTQWISACLGGYIAGRLRTRWIGTHTHEVFFRDTAHGFITWCVATVLMAGGLVPAASSLLTGVSAHSGVPGMPLHSGAMAAAPAAGFGVTGDAGVAAAGLGADAAGELVLPPPAPVAMLPPPTAVGPRAAVLNLGYGSASAWPASELERHDAALNSIVTALAMLVGAFIASVSAAVGGRLRDLHP